MEEQADYVTEALEMMGVIEPRQIVTEISGFIPVFEVVLRKYGDHMTALVFGRMWQYCGMSDGVCRATIDRIASDLQISGATVMRHIEKLEADGYIYDKTPDRRNRPHEYVDCGLVAMKGSLSAIAQKNVRPAQKNVAIAESQLIKQDNTNIKQSNGDKSPLPITAMPLDWQLAGDAPITQQDQFPAKVRDAANLLEHQCLGGGALAETFMLTRNILIPAGKIKGNRKAAKEMLEMGVRHEHVRQATLELMAKNMTVTDLFSVSKTAIDLANKASNNNDRTSLIRRMT
jgi:DNA-binding transcriptional ArsR family regulator